MRAILVLLLTLLSCQPCLNQDPVYYYINFRIVNQFGIDWYVASNTQVPSYLQMSESISDKLYSKMCKTTTENNITVLDCDIDINANSPPTRKFYINISENDTDTLVINTDVVSSRQGSCKIDEVEKISIQFNSNSQIELSSDKSIANWELLKQNKYIAEIVK